MKRIFVAIFSVFMAFGAARADCASNEFAVDDECVESKFQITTTEMDADTTFKFALGAKGTFYVDWGDGTVEKIERTDVNSTSYSHTYSAASAIDGWRISFGGRATLYHRNYNVPSISFQDNKYVKRISGMLGTLFPTINPDDVFSGQPKFFYTFSGCSNLTGILYSELFHGDIYGRPARGMFWKTFQGCNKLTGAIPGDMFANLYGAPVDNMFYGTFQGCGGLTGTIPKNLFAGISGAPASNMYRELFYGCKNLTGTIPSRLFGNLVGPAQGWMFLRTFSGCSKIVGYIPPALFNGITGTSTSMFSQTFNGSGIYTECPCGTHQYITGFESDWDGRVSCEVGTKDNEHWNDGVCTTDCTAGVSALKTSTGLSYPLLTDATAPQNIHIKVNNKICTVPLENGAANNAINMRWNGNTYHATVPDEIVPAGFTGQPE